MFSCQIRCAFQFRHLTGRQAVGHVGGKSLRPSRSTDQAKFSRHMSGPSVLSTLHQEWG